MCYLFILLIDLLLIYLSIYVLFIYLNLFINCVIYSNGKDRWGYQAHDHEEEVRGQGVTLMPAPANSAADRTQVVCQDVISNGVKLGCMVWELAEKPPGKTDIKIRLLCRESNPGR